MNNININVANLIAFPRVKEQPPMLAEANKTLEDADQMATEGGSSAPTSPRNGVMDEPRGNTGASVKKAGVNIQVVPQAEENLKRSGITLATLKRVLVGGQGKLTSLSVRTIKGKPGDVLVSAQVRGPQGSLTTHLLKFDSSARKVSHKISEEVPGKPLNETTRVSVWRYGAAELLQEGVKPGLSALGQKLLSAGAIKEFAWTPQMDSPLFELYAGFGVLKSGASLKFYSVPHMRSYGVTQDGLVLVARQNIDREVRQLNSSPAAGKYTAHGDKEMRETTYSNEGSHKLWFKLGKSILMRAGVPPAAAGVAVSVAKLTNHFADFKGKEYFANPQAAGFPSPLRIGNTIQANEFVSDAASIGTHPHGLFRVLKYYPIAADKDYGYTVNFAAGYLKKVLDQKGQQALWKRFADPKADRGAVMKALMLALSESDLRDFQQVYKMHARELVLHYAGSLKTWAAKEYPNAAKS